MEFGVKKYVLQAEASHWQAGQAQGKPSKQCALYNVVIVTHRPPP